MIEIEKKTGTSGTNLAVGFTGDDLVSGPQDPNFQGSVLLWNTFSDWNGLLLL